MLRVQLFCALGNKDLKWWAIKKCDMSDELLELDGHVSSFLSLPNDAISSVVSLLSHAALVMHKSTRVLGLMAAINYGALLLRRLNALVTRKLDERAMRGLIEPSMEDFTWQYALE